MTRPDISLSVSLSSRYMDKPTTKLWNAAKHVLKYLNESYSYGINFTTSSNHSMIHGFWDASYASDIIYRRSTSSYLFKIE